MARRMVNSKIFINEKVAELDFAGRLFFIGLITNADDDGRIKGSPKYLKALIFPYDDDIKAEKIAEYRDQCHNIKLINFYNIDGSDFICLVSWSKHQTIRSDRYKQSTLPGPNGLQPATNGIPTDNQEVTTGMLNISKVNISKVNIIYTVWNEQEIVIHKNQTDEINRAVASALKDYSEEDISQSIKNYSEIIKDEKYYFKYKWTLKDFLKRGLPKFLDIDIARTNYLKDADNGTHKTGAGRLPTKYSKPDDLRQ